MGTFGSCSEFWVSLCNRLKSLEYYVWVSRFGLSMSIPFFVRMKRVKQSKKVKLKWQVQGDRSKKKNKGFFFIQRPSLHIVRRCQSNVFLSFLTYYFFFNRNIHSWRRKPRKKPFFLIRKKKKFFVCVKKLPDSRLVLRRVATHRVLDRSAFPYVYVCKVKTFEGN